MSRQKTAIELDRLYNEDCIAGMGRIPEGSVDLAFADPPFNIGYKYDVYEDRKAADEYQKWTRQWGAALIRALKPTGTFWLAIGDDFAAELKLIFQRELGLFCRSWIIWYYTFGVNCKFKFSRSHTHLFHFVKDPKAFTFNRDAIRVPSARQLVYADARAHDKGRIPDDTWILRPQDAAGSFMPEENVWYFPRVCGTFKERAGWHGCQMPEQLLGRIIKVSSNPGETILEPFGGSGTTLAVAKKLDRRFIGFELSKNYAAQIHQRLEVTAIGEPLPGAEEPMVTVPKTANGRRLGEPRPSTPRIKRSPRPAESVVRPATRPPVSREATLQIDRGVLDAFLRIRNGFAVERVVADPNLNGQFLQACTSLGLPGKPFDWNHRLMNLRKAGHLKDKVTDSHRTPLEAPEQEFDRCKFACEIALQRFECDQGMTFDDVLCDPATADEFDRHVLSMLLDQPSSLHIRWFALRIRKTATYIRRIAAASGERVGMAHRTANPFDLDLSHIPDKPGMYWLSGASKHLYVGETQNLRARFEAQFGHRKFDFWQSSQDQLRLNFRILPELANQLSAQQSRWIAHWRPVGNYHRLATDSGRLRRTLASQLA